ncbi:glycosyltransferase [Arenivirga flava]|uniref:Glycosyl transferase n=1 Tax=Arenivirga flava TaxID=1930060 RepID=A0AA37XB39_9MICO|nr:glycosyltransferase [Arenivirga flava]GMA28005.1 glycosyl transferase [Arenivirga flava]
MPHVLQNVIFPTSGDPEVLPLYLDPEAWTEIDDDPVRVTAIADINTIRSQRSAIVPAGARVSYAAYFNGFPASYWRRFTKVDHVTLRLELQGEARIVVNRSNPRGAIQTLESRVVTGASQESFTLPLAGFLDGGWYWFEIIAGPQDVELVSGDWVTDSEPVNPGLLDIGITTLNKADYCVRTLRTLADDAALLEQIGRIMIVDQGTKKLVDEPGYDEVAARLGDKLQVIEQANLGGSGGFARSMFEHLEHPDAEYLILLDDDVTVETQGILRALTFARYAQKPTIVGGHMFDLNDRTVLNAYAEVVHLDRFIWGQSTKNQVRHDFRRANLKQTPWMHARMDADYNGWWMCLIPKAVIRKIGLSLPLFIKWDDSEYGLRAKEHGFPTVSLPGAALWHISWLDKDDSIDWQAYFHARNRLVAALLHAPQGRGVLLDFTKLHLKQLLQMQYSAASLRIRAMQDVLRGPEHLHAEIATILPQVRSELQSFGDARIYRDVEEIPSSRRGRVVVSGTWESHPGGWTRIGVWAGLSSLRHFFVKAKDEQLDRPEAQLTRYDATWWRVPRYDSVLITTAASDGMHWYRRDRAQFRKLLREGQALNRRLLREWPKLSARYRAASKDVTSPEAWKQTFGL